MSLVIMEPLVIGDLVKWQRHCRVNMLILRQGYLDVNRNIKDRS